jgi:hypothetical protein
MAFLVTTISIGMSFMHKLVPTIPIEPRWPVGLALLLVVGLLTILPNRYHYFPLWVLYLYVMVILTLMMTVRWTRGGRRWLKAERVVILVFCLVMGVATLSSLTDLIRLMVTGSQGLEGLYLLTSSIGLWVSNVILFSLLYWQIDLGGPEARLHQNNHHHPDWLFPQAGLPEDMMPNWHPTFVDYLFLAFTTATAFSPTDTLPLTPRAKLLIMAESIVSLVNVAAVAARAINVLGS